MCGLAPLAPCAVQRLDRDSERVVGLKAEPALRVLPRAGQPKADGPKAARPPRVESALGLDAFDQPRAAHAHAERGRHGARPAPPRAVELRRGRCVGVVARAFIRHGKVQAAVREHLGRGGRWPASPPRRNGGPRLRGVCHFHVGRARRHRSRLAEALSRTLSG